MDFAVLENIVSKRKLPQPDGKKKVKRRRITPVPVTTTTADVATYHPKHVLAGTTTTGTTLVNYYQRQSESINADAADDNANPTPMYNTTIGHFESTLIVKQRFLLSDTLYVLIGLDSSVSFEPVMYFVDKKWWMQIMTTPECINTIVYFRKRIDDYYKTLALHDFFPLYTEHIKIAPSTENALTISLSRHQDQLAQELPWDEDEPHLYACYQEDTRPVPTITMTREEWAKFCQLSESITEYFALCRQCKEPAHTMMGRYIKHFKTQYRPLATAATRHQQEMRRVKMELNQKLPTEIRHFSWIRIPYDSGNYTAGVSPFGTWLDAEIRANCENQITMEVIDELAQEFPWLKTE